MASDLILLGFTQDDNAPLVRAAMARVPGPPVSVISAGGVAALAQAAARGGRRGLQGRALVALSGLQRRLEQACQVGPFLPADPVQATCPAAELPGLLARAAPELAEALATQGRLVQWDIVLRWQPEPVVRANRAALATAGTSPAALAEAVQGVLARDRAARATALRAALHGTALAMIEAGAGDTETGLTVLVAAESDAALEAALQALPAAVADGAQADLRGPLPPLSFCAVRIVATKAGDVAAAWHDLALPARIDALGLRQQWRAQAVRLHPDLGARDDAPIAAAGAAYRLLRGLLRGGEAVSLPALQGLAARRLLVPALPGQGGAP